MQDWSCVNVNEYTEFDQLHDLRTSQFNPHTRHIRHKIAEVNSCATDAEFLVTRSPVCFHVSFKEHICMNQCRQRHLVVT